ncbi:phospholipase D-like domain-containing protein [Actinacidiphila rubida]|uniref:Uncharacterized protein n=1 Tax=Actinacidiphila rubida TaxID=310780 RepID=A0A1H8K9C9_9ACTN|nr:hypothetical protein [Actinacidiphila rubida]SEN89622.1 hypothetical protein SAMN05216267_101275 [Actinacidiphila rubida]
MKWLIAFARDYALLVICILIATLGLLKVHISGVQYSDSDLILAVLGVLAVSNVAERLGILHSLDQRLADIQRRTENSRHPRIEVANRSEVPRLGERVGSAREELVICGPSLDGAVSIVHQITAAAQRGVRVKILITLSTRENMKQYGRHLTAANYDLVSQQGLTSAQAKIRHNITILKQALDGYPQVEVRTFDGLIWCGYVMVDRGSRQALMDVQVYMYKVPVDSAPLLQLTRESSGEWHDFFSSAFDTMWSDSVAA